MSDRSLHRGDAFPHIQVTTIGDGTFNYATIWQRKHLVFAVVGASSTDDSYASALTARVAEFSALETECVITRDDVTGLRTPGVLIADRWGEVIHVAEASSSTRLPSPDELIVWIEYVRQRCPECEGETR